MVGASHAVAGLLMAAAGAVGAPDPIAITGGTFVPGCGWPTAVSTEACSGTLVDPEIVVLAAHCRAPSTVYLGPDVDGDDGVFVDVTECVTHPEAGGPGDGTDVQWCRLATPQFSVPIVPPLSGCETDVLAQGQPVTIVGYGETPDGQFGRKHEVTAEILALVGPEAQIGGMGKDSCRGDSGAPVFVQLPDGGWRVFGITSYGSADCRSGGFYVLLHTMLPWLEDSTGLDLTPCTTADGVWDPDPRCGRAPADPGADVGLWASGCVDAAVADPIATCGEAWVAPPDDAPPTVTILEPADGARVDVADQTELAAVTVRGEVVVTAWGLSRVEISGDEGPLGFARVPAFAIEVALPAGTYALVAEAFDHAGRRGVSSEVHVEVVGADDDRGCGCRAAGGRGAPTWAWGLVAGWWGRSGRRRRPRGHRRGA